MLYVDAQIVAIELLLRSQAWKLIPWTLRNEIHVLLWPSVIPGVICGNLSVMQDTYRYLVSSQIEKLEAGEFYRTIRLCQDCRFDYTLNAKDFGERGLALCAKHGQILALSTL